jgi:hypothetical protein
MHTSKSKVVADSYDRVVKLCNEMMDAGKSPTHYQALRFGYIGGLRSFDKDRDAAIERGDIDRERYEKFRQENRKFTRSNEVDEPDWSLLHKAPEDTDVPGSRAPEVEWRSEAGKNGIHNQLAKIKIPKSRKKFVEIERSIAKWAKEKGQQFGGRNELRGLA